jgi:hypothetical protein
MRNLSQTIISAQNAAVNQVSTAINCGQIYAASLQCSFSNSGISGTLALQGSNDLTSFLTIPTNWSTVATASVSNSAVTMIPTTQTSYQFVRASWTASAGTGTITVNINSQGF